MTDPPARRALITGASSGLGVAFARNLAALGHDLVLVARREERLRSLAVELERKFPVRAEVWIADLSSTAAVDEVERRIGELASLDLLVNNAGFGIPGRFAEIPIDAHLRMIGVHVIASVRLTRAVLPGMIARRQGAIINVSSLGAFIPKPGDATYCATKAYLKSFSEALGAELQGTGVRVQALCPGFTHTEFHDGPAYAGWDLKAGIPSAMWMSAEDVVAESLDALSWGQVVCVPGWRNRLLVAFARSGLRPLLLKALALRFRQ